MMVQRKWMYLESIFLGGDIRSQLPESAKRFDRIDSAFRKASGYYNIFYLNNVMVYYNYDIMTMIFVMADAE